MLLALSKSDLLAGLILLTLYVLLVKEIHDVPFISLYIEEASLSVPELIGLLSMLFNCLLTRTALPMMFTTSVRVVFMALPLNS